MNILIVYDTYFGNTAQVAKNYQKELEKDYFVTLVSTKELVIANIEQFNVIIFGSPTRAFNMTSRMKKILKSKKYSFENKYVAVFDTRMDITVNKSKVLPKMVKWFGYAAPKMEKILLKRQAKILSPYQHYFVMDTEGPLEIDIANRIKAECKVIKQKIMELGL